nr:MAG TPA: hypothetical protein [Caudoviricetes sp.]
MHYNQRSANNTRLSAYKYSPTLLYQIALTKSRRLYK